MEMEYRRRARLVAALVIVSGVGAAVAPSAPAAAASARVALGACWLNKISVGLGDDLSARFFVTRWYAGSAQTIIQGQAPHARYWSMTLYHQQRGKIVPLYDQQITGGAASGAFKLVIGGARPGGKAAYVDPTAGGGDSQGYLFYRLYKVAGAVTLPTVTIKGGPSAAASCSGLETNLNAALNAANQKTPANGQTVGQCVKCKRLWPAGTTPYRAWSLAINPAAYVPVNNVQSVPLVTQLADPSIVYRVFQFNVSNGDVVLHGKLPPISPQAPGKGMRYWSICAYSNNANLQPFSCINDQNLKVSHGEYVIVISPDNQPGNWINPGNLQTGSIVMRWVLPNGGVKAGFCVPSLLTDRQPGDTTVPPLPSSC